MIDNLILLLFTFLMATGQLLFKKVGLDLRGHSLASGVPVVLRAPALYAALLLYAVATLIWIWILSRVSLSRAYPYVALGVVLVPLASGAVYGDTVRPIFWVGAALIVVGILVTQLGSPG